MLQNERFVDSAPEQSASEVTETKSRSRLGVIVTGVLGGSLVALYAVAAPFVLPALRKVCLPFVPATAAQLENVLKVLRARKGSLVDIGSGDGRIVSDLLLISHHTIGLHCFVVYHIGGYTFSGDCFYLISCVHHARSPRY